MKPREHDPVKLVVSVFTGDQGLFKKVFERLTERFGPIDYLTGLMGFSHTDYYEKEFGPGLKRKVASFEALRDIGELAEIKKITNGVEGDFLSGGNRLVNIDPGYMTLDKLALASCKDFSHRIYLGGGVYGEVTLMWSRTGGFTDLPWTYPDYKKIEMKTALEDIRGRYAFRLGKGL